MSATPERWRLIKELFTEAVGLEGDARAQFLAQLAQSDPTLGDEICSLLAAHEAPNALLDRSACSFLPASKLTDEDRWSGRRLGAYVITGLIGRGGMGEVYRARRADDQYEQQVAIKLVRAGYDTAYMLEKFRAERQILANLDHPNIARLLDGGTTADDLPYVVMEFVDGQPIDAYCDQRTLPIKERLLLFRQACAAVSYAHRHLIIHRDLKPGNILVTPDGRVKLVDFGIAKLIQPDSLAASAHVTVVAAVTPAFASPEQLLGQPVTTATDVYSLGVVLFHLLTGRSPYRTSAPSTHDAIREVCETEPSRPSQLVAAAQGDAGQRPLPDRELDDITLKALRKEPDRRYGSVEQMSDDIGRYLEGLPVRAHGDRFGYHAGKFLRRHKIEVAAAALVSLTLFAGSLVSIRAARIARQQEAIALRERARVEKRFADVRNLTGSLIFDVHDAIQKLPGATPARKLLLERATEYLDNVARDASGDVAMERELAWGYQRLAVVQGSPTESNLGDLRASLESDQKALGYFEAVAAARPADFIDQLNVAMMHRILAFSHLTDPQGPAQLAAAMAITDRLTRTDPASPQLMSERSIEFQNLALLDDARGERVQALEAYRRNYELKLQLLRAHPDYHDIERRVGMASSLLGGALARSGSPEQGLAMLRAGMERYRALARGDADTNVRREFAIAEQQYGGIELMLGDQAGARAHFLAASQQLRALASADPLNSMLRLDVAGVEFNAGRLAMLAGANREAIARFTIARRLMRQLDAPRRSAEDEPASLAAVEIWLGDAWSAAGDPRRALASYHDAEQAAMADAAAASNDDARGELALSWTRAARANARIGNVAAASADIAKAIEFASAVLGSANEDVPALYTAAEAFGTGAALGARRAQGALDPAARREASAHRRLLEEQSRAAWQRIGRRLALSPSGFLVYGGERRIAPHGPAI